MIINGIDFSRDVNERTYSVDYEKRTGSNGGKMLNGDEIVDILAYKAVLTWNLNYLTADRLSTVLKTVLTDYVYVSYFDTWTNAQRWAYFIPTIGKSSYAFSRNGKKFFRDGMTLTLKER